MVARMRRKRPDIDIVEVVIAERGAIGESREIGRGARIGADHGGGAAAPGRQCHLAADPHRRLAERRNAAADGVDHMRLDPLDGRGIEIVVAQRVRVGGQPLGERTRRRLRCRSLRHRNAGRKPA